MVKKTVQPFYDPKLSYEDNYRLGPFGLFSQSPPKTTNLYLPPALKSQLFGIPLDLPFGIPAGPLLNGQFVESAWRWGYSLATYKTVRGASHPTHPHPNIVRVTSDQPNIHPGETVIGHPDIDQIQVERDGITNSFGVPSQPPEVWQADVRQTLTKMPPGSTMILSFMGTKTDQMSRDEYIQNFAQTCRLAVATGAPVLEVNFSCPNFGKEGLICQDTQMSADILEALAPVIGNVPLLVKIGYFGPDQRPELDKLLQAIHRFAQGVCAINTISATVVDAQGQQFLPGSPVRLSSGICGTAIKWAGLEMAEYLVSQRPPRKKQDFAIIGVGGVTTVQDYFDYMKIGVDAVQSATGAMWKPDLAIQIRRRLREQDKPGARKSSPSRKK